MIISLVCSIASLIATIVIAVVQYKQNKAMKELSERQDIEERKRRAQQIKAQRNSFIMRYHNRNNEIYLLPLCWIASIYSPTLSYCRKMYMEFNMLEEDVQDAICEYMNLKLKRPLLSDTDFYKECISALLAEEKKYQYGNAPSLFYDNAKYLRGCIEHNRTSAISLDTFTVCSEFNNQCGLFHNSPAFYPNPIYNTAVGFGFSNSNYKQTCEICAIAANFLASNVVISTSQSQYWIPGQYGNERLETLEDLFLCALFSIYVNLILPKEEVSNDKT